MVDEGVRRAYTDKDNPLRASVLDDPDGARKSTRDNTPAVVHMEVVPGHAVEVKLAAKGGGSESKTRFSVLNPSDDVVEWILGQVPTMGGDWCPPGILGVGIGGTPEKAMVMAKESLMAPLDIHELVKRGAANRAEALRLELYEKVNALGIGAQGLGGLTTVLDVKVLDYPTHAVMKPVAIVPNCAATRHIEFRLDGSGPASFAAPSLEHYPKVAVDLAAGATRVDLERLTKAGTARWKAGERLLLSGKILTGRDAAHKRLTDLLAKGENCPWSSRTASSTTSARSTQCATRPSAPPARPHRGAWTSSWSPCSRTPACWDRSANPSAAKQRSRRSGSTGACISSRWAAPPTSSPKRSGRPACWRSPSSAWRRCASSKLRTCR